MWKYGFASVAGTSHVKASLACQDSSHVEVFAGPQGEEILLAVASDGAGSAVHGHLGSQLACDLLIDEVKTHFAGRKGWAQLEEEFIHGWIGKFQHLVAGWSGELPKTQDFACTLLAAVIGQENAAYFHIGDGAIVASLREDGENYQCVCWPQQGEYANTTNFLTDVDAVEKIFCGLKSNAVDEVALFTDGIQSLVLDYRKRTAHSSFFAAMFSWLRLRSEGYSRELSDSLVTYLNSEKINTRTDDDKTLVLATRR
ncbi:MAG: protein phosphatase 2C domain-containing protein [Acidobacteria bacterium]|nr:protein phosphatase 2C domain-containing protein [Acidobacteriota bacterium]